MDSEFVPPIDVQQLSALPLLKGISAEEFELIFKLATIERLPANKIVIHEGDLTCDIFFVLEGEIIVSKWDEEHFSQVLITKLSKNEVFGEMSYYNPSI